MYIYDSDKLVEIETFADYLDCCREVLMQNGRQFPENYELVLDLGPSTSPEDERALTWRYYFVDHATKSVFWLRSVEMDDYLSEVKGMRSPAHVRALIL